MNALTVAIYGAHPGSNVPPVTIVALITELILTIIMLVSTITSTIVELIDASFSVSR